MTTNAEQLIDALKWILRDGFYDDDGNFVLRHGEWDGTSDPPDTSDPPSIANAVELLESMYHPATIRTRAAQDAGAASVSLDNPIFSKG